MNTVAIHYEKGRDFYYLPKNIKKGNTAIPVRYVYGKYGTFDDCDNVFADFTIGFDRSKLKVISEGRKFLLKEIITNWHTNSDSSICINFKGRKSLPNVCIIPMSHSDYLSILQELNGNHASFLNKGLGKLIRVPFADKDGYSFYIEKKAVLDKIKHLAGAKQQFSIGYISSPERHIFTYNELHFGKDEYTRFHGADIPLIAKDSFMFPNCLNKHFDFVTNGQVFTLTLIVKNDDEEFAQEQYIQIT